MDDYDDDDFVTFGTPLEPLEEDAVIRKKPVNIQDQIVTDDHGRRRFHGAFTGGFSAGYYNTVGSKEGWAPSTFKSTRNDRSSFKSQNVHDFMDAEDVGSFGIAPQILRPTEDFSTAKTREISKRPRPTQSDGPIPGDPVLHQIIQPVIETVGVRVLRKMGWRPGQGIGPKVSKRKIKTKQISSEKRRRIQENEDDDEEMVNIEDKPKMYGCSLPPKELKRIMRAAEGGDDEDVETDSEDDDDNDDENIRPLLVAPNDTNSPICNPKENTFGLGYKGLDRNTLVSSHVDLFGPSLKFKVENKKMNIAGEAFGIGVFEDADEEVYSREDMTQYDFALETTQERKARLLQEAKDKKNNKKSDSSCIPGFVPAKKASVQQKYFPPPQIPHDFQPIHHEKKSRFSSQPPPSGQIQDQNKSNIQNINTTNQRLGLDRHQLTRDERQILVGDFKAKQSEVESVKPLDKKIDFTPSIAAIPVAKEEETTTISDEKKDSVDRIERLKKFAEVLQAFSSQKSDHTDKGFKPFLKNPTKQERYEKFLTLKTAGFAECLKDLQPLEMTEWEREREKMEFERASALFKPMAGEMSSRFVSAKSHDISHIVPEREKELEKDPSQDPKVAAKMNLFGKLTHKVLDWNPDRIVCKRFNVPAPYPNSKVVGVVRSESTTSRRNEPELKESIGTKKSLFDDLDFSKPPPGLLPVAAISEPMSSYSASASTSASSQQLDVFPATTTTDSILESSASSFSLGDGEIAAMPLSKPPLDLFKEIFADTSSEEEDDVIDDKNGKDKRDHSTLTNVPSSNTKNLSGDPRKEEKQLDKVEGERKRERRWDSKNPSTYTPIATNSKESLVKQNEGREETRGIFHNLDLSQLMPATISSSSAPPPSLSTSEKTSPTMSTSRVSKMSKSEPLQKMDQEPINDEPIYGPAPPVNIQRVSLGAGDLAKSQMKKPYNYSSPIFTAGCKERVFSSENVSKSGEEEIIWVEKDKLKDSSTKDKKSSKSKKHSKKFPKSRRSDRHSSKSKKAKTHKSSSKHKSSKSKKRKTAKSERKHGHKDKSESSSETESHSSEDSENSS